MGGCCASRVDSPPADPDGQRGYNAVTVPTWPRRIEHGDDHSATQTEEVDVPGPTDPSDGAAGTPNGSSQIGGDMSLDLLPAANPLDGDGSLSTLATSRRIPALSPEPEPSQAAAA